jgi:hypothetical protein
LGHDLDVHENKKPVEIKVVSSNNRVSMWLLCHNWCLWVLFFILSSIKSQDFFYTLGEKVCIDILNKIGPYKLWRNLKVAEEGEGTLLHMRKLCLLF